VEINKSNSKTKKETGINKSKNFIQRKAIIEQLKNELNIKEKKLEEEKAKLDKELYDAVEKNNYEKVKECLREGANIEVNYYCNITPLWNAASNGNKKMVELLIKNNANINVRSNMGWTPVNMATNLGHLEVVRILIVNKADLNVPNMYNGTALYYAVKKENKEIENLLINNGAKVSLIEMPLWYRKDMFMDFMRIYLKQLVN